jgi:hypothetical protein
MQTSTELNAIARKVQQAYYEDGLADIFMGVLLLGLAAFITLLAYHIYFLVFMILALNPLFYIPLIERAKQRWVYPRAGYVKPKPLQETSTRGAVLVLFAIVLLVIIPAVTFFILSSYTGLFFWLVWMAPATLGLLISIGPFFIAYKYHIARYYLFAVLPPPIGAIVPWLNLSFPSAYAAFFTTLAIQFAIVALLALFSGIVLFLRFLRRYPVEPTDSAEGEKPHVLA